MVRLSAKKAPTEEPKIEDAEPAKAAPAKAAPKKRAPRKAPAKVEKVEEVVVEDVEAVAEDVPADTNADEVDADLWDELAILDDADGRRVYRASLLGSCTTVLVGAAIGEELADLPANIRLRADEGTMLESVILAKFHEDFAYRAATYPELADLKRDGVIAGYNPEMEQVQVRLDVGKSARVQAHPDEIATHVKWNEDRPRRFVDVEAKALGEDYWKSWQRALSSCDTPQEACKVAFDRYAWQVSARMACTGLPVIFVCGRKKYDEEGVIAAEVDELSVTLFETPPYSAGELKARVMRAEKYAREGVVPDCDKPDYPCPMYSHPAHPENAKDEIAWVPVDGDDELRDCLIAIEAYKADAKAATDAVNAERKKLDVLMARHEISQDVAGNYLVDGRVRFSWIVVEKKGYEVKPSTQRYPKIETVA